MNTEKVEERGNKVKEKMEARKENNFLMLNTPPV
jgi:hypothetical protein